MSDISEVEELCVLLKLCIKRNTQPTTMKDLNKLYKDLSDSDLQKDVLKRGYSSIESFLKSRPKIFNIIRKSAGHNTIVTCEVGNDKFAGERLTTKRESKFLLINNCLISINTIDQIHGICLETATLLANLKGMVNFLGLFPMAVMIMMSISNNT